MFRKIYFLYYFWWAQTCSFRAVFGLAIWNLTLVVSAENFLYRCTSTFSALNWYIGIFFKCLSYLYEVWRTNLSADFWTFRIFDRNFSKIVAPTSDGNKNCLEENRQKASAIISDEDCNSVYHLYFHVMCIEFYWRSLGSYVCENPLIETGSDNLVLLHCRCLHACLAAYILRRDLKTTCFNIHRGVWHHGRGPIRGLMSWMAFEASLQ